MSTSGKTRSEDPKAIEKDLQKMEKRDTTLVKSVENEIKSLEKKLTKLTKSCTKSDKKVLKATTLESKTAKKASDANIKHEKAVINLRSFTERGTITKKDRDSTSQMLDSKRRELETAITTKRQHDDQAALKRAELPGSGTNP